MPRKHKTTITVPPELATALHAERDRMMKAHVEGKRNLPDDYCERIPLHYVISELLRFKNDHTMRSRRGRICKDL